MFKRSVASSVEGAGKGHSFLMGRERGKPLKREGRERGRKGELVRSIVLQEKQEQKRPRWVRCDEIESGRDEIAVVEEK